MAEVSKYDDVIDSRDVIERLDELETELDDAWQGQAERTEEDDFSAWVRDMANDPRGTLQDAAQEYLALYALAAEAEQYATDWEYGETLIRDSYFAEYVEELVSSDMGVTDGLPAWVVVDWEATARNVRVDYTSVDFDGVTYWCR